MFNSIRAVTDTVGDHLVRGARNIVPGSYTGTAEGLVKELSEAEGKLLDLIRTGAVRRNQLDQVRVTLQATRMLKKFRYGGDPAARREAALAGFIDRNRECGDMDRSSFLRRVLLKKMASILRRALPCPYDGRLIQHPEVVISDAFTAFRAWGPSEEIRWGPRFGTGAVFEDTPFLKRWEMVDGSSPILEAIRTGSFDRIVHLMPHTGVSSVQVVPKEFTKDRVITNEELVSTFLQHGVRRVVYESIHAGPLAWTAMDVMHLEDASKINGRYALTGSRDSSIATIDQRDASDYIFLGDVEDVMPAWLVPLLHACRATHFLVGDGERKQTIVANMYAGMGNASTFVVESLMFWAACQAAMAVNGLRCEVCSVYGDDVVIDSRAVPYVLEAFEALGWKVNVGKSYWGQCPLRESCGVWAFNGLNITPARFDGYDLSRPGGQAGFREAISMLLTRGAGLGLVVADALVKQCGHLIPISALDIPGSCVVFDKYNMWVNNHIRVRTRLNKDTQQYEVKGETLEQRTVEVPADRVGYLYGSLAGQLHTAVSHRRGGLSNPHVVRIPVPRRYKLKKRWLVCLPPVGSRSSIRSPQAVSRIRVRNGAAN